MEYFYEKNDVCLNVVWLFKPHAYSCLSICGADGGIRHQWQGVMVAGRQSAWRSVCSVWLPSEV